MPDPPGALAQQLADVIKWFRPTPPPAQTISGTPEQMLRAYLQEARVHTQSAATFQRLLDSLPPGGDASAWTVLTGAAVTGMAEGAAKEIEDTVKALDLGFKAILKYYELSYDPAMWRAVLNAWNDPSDLTPVLRTIQARHPDLYEALGAARPLARKLDDLDKQLKASDENLLIVLIKHMLANLAEDLVEKANEIAGHKGDPYEQGRAIGIVSGKLVVATIVVGSMLYPVVSTAAKAGKLSLRAARRRLKPSEMRELLDEIEKVTPGVVRTARRVARTNDEVMKLYDDLAGTIQPYGTLRSRTKAFNADVRLIYDLSVYDMEVLELALDAHHIILKRPYLARFKPEFKRRLGWASEDDMDSIALHGALHRHRPHDNFGLEGAADLASLHRRLDDFVAARDHAGFTLEELIDAHEDAYKSFLYPRQGDAVNLRGQPISKQVYEGRLKDWFAQIRQRLKDNP